MKNRFYTSLGLTLALGLSVGTAQAEPQVILSGENCINPKSGDIWFKNLKIYSGDPHTATMDPPVGEFHLNGTANMEFPVMWSIITRSQSIGRISHVTATFEYPNSTRPPIVLTREKWKEKNENDKPNIETWSLRNYEVDRASWDRSHSQAQPINAQTSIEYLDCKITTHAIPVEND
ncbi:MAG TPA: hypothetical protein VKR58_08145 [Aquella sp.]|nr:hypothetical protein [Aquella sp.]